MVGRLVASAREWALWRLPRRAAVYVVVVVVLPVVAGAVLLVASVDSYRRQDLWVVLELSLCAVVSIEGARRVGMPTLVRGRPSKDLVSVWIFAIALLVPAPYVLLAAAVLVPLLVRGVFRHLYRRAFNAAGFALAGLAGHEVLTLVTGQRALPQAAAAVSPARLMAALLLALVAYELVNGGLVTVAIWLVEPSLPMRHAVGDGATLITDMTALTLGLLAAVAWTVTPGLALAAIPPVVLLQRAVIHDELREAAQTDGKTGLATAAHWLGVAQRCTERAQRASTCCAVLLLDVDYFKVVNDTWGHLAGDELLAQLAATLRSGVRPSDLVGRLGGEEFGVLLPDTGLVEAAAVAERLRAAVASRSVQVAATDDAARARVTVSVGVANTVDAGYSVSDLLASADAALYRAKAGGRDRVEVGGRASDAERLWLSHVPAGALATDRRP